LAKPYSRFSIINDKYKFDVLSLYKKKKLMETTVVAPVSFTEGAIKEIKRIMSESGFDNTQYLRVGVKGGGCSGLSYQLGFDQKEADDEIYEIDGIPVVMKLAHGIYLLGINIHFEDGLNARGFTFNNPNASSTCGCGTSFAV
jgi:iron-sulfur cluster assembly protein